MVVPRKSFGELRNEKNSEQKKKSNEEKTSAPKCHKQRESKLYLFFFGKWLADSDQSSGFHNSLWEVPKTCSHKCELNMMFCCIDHKESVRIQDFAIKQKDDEPLKATQGHSSFDWL